jgi:hypothetical protein
MPSVLHGVSHCVSQPSLPQPVGYSAWQVPRALFLQFVGSHPRALLLYLQQALARLWRVAHFMLSDYLSMPLYKQKVSCAPPQSSCIPDAQEIMQNVGVVAKRQHDRMHGAKPVTRELSNPGEHALKALLQVWTITCVSCYPDMHRVRQAHAPTVGRCC